MSSKISCVIHTYNSAMYLDQCLQSVRWTDEIVVVDMHSTDNTRVIAEKHGAKIFLHENIGYADPARKFGLEKCSHDWILSLDSDEVVPKALAQKLQDISKNNGGDVAYLSFRNFFFGRELKGTGWSYKHIYVPRFFKRGALSYGHEVHNFIQIQPQSRILKLIDYDLAIVHFNYDSVEQFISKLNRYTDFEAKKENAYAGNPWFQMGYHFVRELFGRFFVKRGFLDGWVGLYLSIGMAFYRCTAVAKKNLPSAQEAQQQYKKYGENVPRL